MADDKDKQKFSYRPDIEYQDTYESDHSNKSYSSVDTTSEQQSTDNKEVIDDITKTFNEVSKIIPLLPVELQTAINGVYKPILDSWASVANKDIKYPSKIPDPNKPIYKLQDNVDNGSEVPNTETKFMYPVPPDLPEPSVDDDDNDTYEINNDGIWDIDIPMTINFEEVNPIEIIEKEYIKNVADLFNYYVNRLKDILYHYYSEKITATFGKKIDANGNLTSKTKAEVAFLFNPITDCCSDVKDDSKHLFDASISMSERSKLKLCFLGNAFPVEQSLFHLKNFKTIYALRLRYANIDAVNGSNKVNAMSNNILKGMKTSYDQKYDVAFMNLYKYLNSSLDILEDVTNTELAGLRARRTLIEKGGIKK